MSADLQRHLLSVLPDLHGPWVASNSGYEGALCAAAQFRLAKSRYWDAYWGDHTLEVKKGTSIWIDLVRLGEIVLALEEDARTPTTTLFFIPDKTRSKIRTVMAVPTSKIIETMNLSKDQWSFLTGIPKVLPRQLNAQASLTQADIRHIASFVV